MVLLEEHTYSLPASRELLQTKAPRYFRGCVPLGAEVNNPLPFVQAVDHCTLCQRTSFTHLRAQHMPYSITFLHSVLAMFVLRRCLVTAESVHKSGHSAFGLWVSGDAAFLHFISPKPKATEPKATEPKATKPKATKLKAIKPKATKPKATKPKATMPILGPKPVAKPKLSY